MHDTQSVTSRSSQLYGTMNRRPQLLIFFAVAICLAGVSGQIVRSRGGTNQFARFKAQFENGDTNAPLLAMDWFSHGEHLCRVSRAGMVFAGRNVGFAIEGGHQASLDAANKFLLMQAINHLPESLQKSLPQERQLLIAGIRSNQWFECVYDRADVPGEAEKLFEITGAYLEWYIPRVEGHVLVHSDHGNLRGSQAGISSFAVAGDAPVAVSTGVNDLQIWDLGKSSGGSILPLDQTPYRAGSSSLAALSASGGTLIFTGDQGSDEKAIYAFDWRNKELLWEVPRVNLGNTYDADGRVLAVGNSDHSLYVSETDRIECWDMTNGTRIATLITNQAGTKFLRSSRDGKILVAGFGDNSFWVWRTDKNEPIFYFKEPDGAGSVAVSPDGSKIALCTRVQNSGLVLWNVETRARKEFPLRTPQGSNVASALFWSPDGKWLAARVNTYVSSIVIYDTSYWKPSVQWPCGQIMALIRFGFRDDGVFLAIRDHDISGLELTKSKGSSEPPK